jgi:hypothetical protein
MDEHPDPHDFSQEHFCDVHLLGLEWLEPGRDLQLRLRMPKDKTAPQYDARLICRWAHELKLTLDFPEDYGGKPFTFDGRVEQRTDGTWKVRFDFASRGELSLRCTSVEWIEER